MFDISDAIKSVGEAFTSLFNWLKANKDTLAETQIIKELKKREKAHEITEDELKKALEDVQKATDKTIKEIDEIVAAKENEIMEV